MNEKNLSMVCLAIVVVGILIFVIGYNNEFENKRIGEMKLGEKGIVFGKVEHVIKNNPVSIFILSDGNSIIVYYPKATSLKKNDFVTAYVEKQSYNEKDELYAYRIVDE